MVNSEEKGFRIQRPLVRISAFGRCMRCGSWNTVKITEHQRLSRHDMSEATMVEFKCYDCECKFMQKKE